MTQSIPHSAHALSRENVEGSEQTSEAHLGPAPEPFDVLQAKVNAAMAGYRPQTADEVARITSLLMRIDDAEDLEARVLILSDACFYFERVGRSFDGIPLGRRAVSLARTHGFRNLERRANNTLGNAHLDNANFEEACLCLERTLALAREMGDPFLECAAYSTIGLLLKVMGLYQDALEVIDRALACPVQTAQADHLRFINAGNGLFCAHRLHRDDAALRYMGIACETMDNPLVDLVTRSTFEYFRCVYLLAHGDEDSADLLIEAARERATPSKNPRVEILLGTAAALCDWASRDRDREARARKSLRELYHLSRTTGLYHDDVLRALVQTHGRQLSGEFGHETLEQRMQASIETSRIGVAYAKELVEYTTSVKRAKFYRQLGVQDAKTPTDGSATSTFHPTSNLKEWLAPVATTPATTDRFHRHDELSAVHDDIAHLRTAGIRGAIRTPAYHTAENWALAAEFFDDQTGQHCFRVGRLAGLLAAEIGLSPEYVARIEHAARLHDIGKVSVNELILMKPGPLDPSEVHAMRAHTEVGGYLLQGSDDPTLKMAADIALCHHEWWNGDGYPNHLAGERIPLAARICAIADVYDALTNARSYKRAWTHRESVEQMMQESGAHFDPRLMRPFLKVLERHVGSNATPPSTSLHLQDMDANGLLASRRSLMATVEDASGAR